MERLVKVVISPVAWQWVNNETSSTK